METYDRPLSDARYAPIEKTKFTRGARCANFLYGPRKSEFGDSLVKVLFFEKQSPEKTRSDIRLVGFDFFQELPDWQVTD
jgi:hypothetical protein